MPTFLHAPLLWGLLLAGVPVLIHLINMMRHRRVEWAAMEFLLVSQKKNRTWVLLKQLLLLAMRMLAVAMVVLAVAQPLLQDELGTLLGGSKTHHVVLLDDSFSMSDRRNGASIMNQAKDVVERIAAMAAGRVESGTFTLLRFSRAGGTGRQNQWDMCREQAGGDFLNRLREMVKTMGPSQTAAGPTDAIRAIGRLLDENEDENRVVYLVSDFRRKEWDRPEALKSQLSKLPSRNVALHLIDCVEKARANLAITRLEPSSGTRAAGVSMFMEIEVHNFGTSTAHDVSVILEEDGHARPAAKIREIPPRNAVTERFEVSFAAAGGHRVIARLDSDPINVDNCRYAVVDVPLEVPVLIVDGSVDAQGALFLSSALAPGGAVRTGIQPRVETPRFLSTGSLDSYHVVYLTDVEHLDESAVAALERYVADGGGLAFFMGPRCRAGFLNEALWRKGQGLLPVPVAGESELFVDRLDKVPDVEVTDHPVFRIFGGKDNSFLATIKVSRYFAAPERWKPDTDSAARVIARLRGGAPLAVERSFGKGRLVVWLTTAAPIWNNAGANPSFPVLIQEMQAYLARRPTAGISPPLGAPLELTFHPDRYKARVGFLTPHEESPEATPRDAQPAGDGLLRVRFTETDTAGFYEARLLSTTGSVEPRCYALNVDAREGDLARLDASQLAGRLDTVQYTYHRADAFELGQEDLAGYNLGDALLYVLVLLLIAEQLLARSCSYHPPRTGKTALPSLGGAS